MTFFSIFLSIWIVFLPLVAIGGIAFRLIAPSRIIAAWDRLVGLILLIFLLSPCLALVGEMLYLDSIIIPEQRERISQDSRRIIDALYEYKNHYRCYPSELSELVPAYLDQVPRHPYGYPYQYTLQEGEFRLEYIMPYSSSWLGQLFCTYYSKDDSVRCFD